ncbi:GAF and ANTAR domain-containing protein [Nocardioides humi]|uniref:GAF domain-containing protein n=1 Tax=Nocardioides humi TaxID=449461 RepID=A0ABN2BKE5_9ACTN|nr:GAF and ANTAR domain-containing protein [Nocardioides humi]
MSTHPPSVQGLCALALRLLPVDGVGVVLVSSAGYRTLAGAAGELTAALEEIAVLCVEGPAIDAAALGLPVLVEDLGGTASRARWPVFTGEALALGVSANAALPVQVGAIRLGVVVAHRRTVGMLPRVDLAQLLRLADDVGYLLLDARPAQPDQASGTGTPPAEQPMPDFVGAEIHQASGMVMVQLGVPIDAAWARLRAYAFAHGHPLGEVAHAVVTRRLRFEA